MLNKTPAERKAAERKRKRAAGLKEIRNLWIKPEHEARVREAAQQIDFGADVANVRHISKTNEGKT